MPAGRPQEARTQQSVDAARKALLEAVARGRTRAYRPVVVPAPDRKASPVSRGLQAEEWELCTERDHPQGWVPLTIVRQQEQQGSSEDPSATRRRPTVVFLHATGGSRESVRGRQEEYAALGYVTASIDCRYHGLRAGGRSGAAARTLYEDALVKAWKEGEERPFLLDNVWDILHLMDYLVRRPDVDPDRIGITGFSLGGMHAWLAAAADPRIAAVAAVSGVQGFGWAINNDAFQARVDSIPRVFAVAAEDLGKPAVDAEVVLAVWNRIAPGLAKAFDAPHSLPCIAPRPMLVATGEKDPRCPLKGVVRACRVTKATYAKLLEQQRTAGRQQQQGSEGAELLASVTTAESELARLSTATGLYDDVDGLAVDVDLDDEPMEPSTANRGAASSDAGDSCLSAALPVPAPLHVAEDHEAEGGRPLSGGLKDGRPSSGSAQMERSMGSAASGEHEAGEVGGQAASADGEVLAAGQQQQQRQPAIDGAESAGGSQASGEEEAAATIAEASQQDGQPASPGRANGAEAEADWERSQILAGESAALLAPEGGAVQACTGTQRAAAGMSEGECIATELVYDIVAEVVQRAEAEAAADEARRLAREARDAALRDRRELEEAVTRRFALFVDPGVGHQETPAMNRAVLEFLNAHLLLPATDGPVLSEVTRRCVVL